VVTTRKEAEKQIQMMVFELHMLHHHSQALGPHTIGIRKGHYDYCGMQQLLKVK
jgi:hypothetical protein